MDFELETVAAGLAVPWGLEFAPDGRIFVTERPGRVRVVEEGRLREESWAELSVGATGEAGLMGIALAPDFPETGHVYVLATFRDLELREPVNRVVRLTDRDGRGGDTAVVVDGLPAARFHAGGALAFGPDGMLYVGSGDAGRPQLAQDPGSLAGKILRYRPDGGVPADNPIPGSPVYALGLRNPQGLDWHPETGDLFATDHGPSGLPEEGFRRGRDELNAILPGGNYGWPEATGWDHAGFLPPLAVWTPALAPSGLTIYRGGDFDWRGSAFVGALRGRQLHRVVLERDPGSPTGWRAAAEFALLNRELGRLRALSTGLDGHLYLTTSNRDGRGTPAPEDDRVLRIVPAGAHDAAGWPSASSTSFLASRHADSDGIRAAGVALSPPGARPLPFDPPR